MEKRANSRINVDVIVPVHNAGETVKETVESALNQWIPEHLLSTLSNIDIDVAVCCHDDGSTDDSLRILKEIEASSHERPSDSSDETATRQSDDIVPGGRRIHTRLLIGTNSDGVARGAGFARNRAAELRARNATNEEVTATLLSFLCLLDSDDIMHHSRIAEQLHVMLSIPNDDKEETQDRTLLGCTFDRIPAGSTWHYSEWANGLTDERLLLERYREVTLLQPTWFVSRRRFEKLGGYVEAPHPNQASTEKEEEDEADTSAAKCSTARGCSNTDINTRTGNSDTASAQPAKRYRLVHSKHDNSNTLRLAEDLRFFHEHLRASGLLKLHRHGPSDKPLITYRHRAGQSQSSSTPRKLLLNLRVKAFEDTVLRVDPRWADGFVIWGAGRDGKDFFKSLSHDLRARVRCFADVDEKKISAGFYANPELGVKVPIVHFSLLATNPNLRTTNADTDVSFGRITKGKKGGDNAADSKSRGSLHVGLVGRRSRTESGYETGEEGSPKKKQRKLHNLGPNDSKQLDVDSLQRLPIVVCVAMYRTNGVLESNVQSIGRVEGETLWHFS